MENIYTIIEKTGLVPVVVLDDASDALPLAQALCDGGLPCAEVTFRTAAAEESIRRMCSSFPNMLVGAGTVLTTEQVDRAVRAGARFIVSPGFNPTTVKYCLERDIPILPGTSSASDVEAALGFGLEVVKFFPAEQAGGLEMIKALSAPYTRMRFMPTGGINADNMLSYLANDKIIACGGSWMVKGDLIKEKAFDKVRSLTEAAVQKMLGFDIHHIGINCADGNEAALHAEAFCSLFGLSRKETPDSIFAGTAVELMKSPRKGKGQIVIGTHSVLRAKQYLERRGSAFDEDTAVIKNGKMISICLAQEIADFAVQLVQK